MFQVYLLMKIFVLIPLVLIKSKCLLVIKVKDWIMINSQELLVLRNRMIQTINYKALWNRCNKQKKLIQFSVFICQKTEMEHLLLVIMIFHLLQSLDKNLFGLKFHPMKRLGQFLSTECSSKMAQSWLLILKELCLIQVFLMLLCPKKM